MFYGLLKWLEMFNILCMLSFDQIKTSLRARGMWINIQDGVCISMQILMEKYQDILSQPDQECDQILHHSSQQSSSWILDMDLLSSPRDMNLSLERITVTNFI